jgi:hypothetical protein
MSEHDERALAVFREAAGRVTPSPFHAARAAKSMQRRLEMETRSRVRWTHVRVALVATLAAGSGAAGVGLVVTSSGGPVGATAELRASGEHHIVSPTNDPHISAAPRADRVPVVAIAADTTALALIEARPPRMAARARGWRERAAALVDSGDGVGAARVLVRALAHDDSAAASLTLVARRFPGALQAVDGALAQVKTAEAMRLRCEQLLLRVRDASAVAACRAFAREHPEHPGARTLSFAAGRLAEDTLGDLALAEEAYTRALLLSPFSGLPGTDALLARARVRAARGDVDEARADLRLYLHNEPQAAADGAVRELMTDLGLSPARR